MRGWLHAYGTTHPEMMGCGSSCASPQPPHSCQSSVSAAHLSGTVSYLQTRFPAESQAYTRVLWTARWLALPLCGIACEAAPTHTDENLRVLTRSGSVAHVLMICDCMMCVDRSGDYDTSLDVRVVESGILEDLIPMFYR